MKLTKTFINEIRELILAARTIVVRSVDLVQVHTNFKIGRRIVEEEQQGNDRATYGKQVIKVLSTRLMREFGKGFSESNLEYMRRFYLIYQNRLSISQSVTGKLTADSKKQPSTGRKPISQSLTGKLADPAKSPISQSLTGELESTSARPPFTLSWTHYVFLLSVENDEERSFYEIESTQQDWKVRELKRQYDSSLYERLALSRDKEGIHRLATEGHTVAHPHDLLKEPLVLEFLGLQERSYYSESDLETAIIDQIERFLLELGKGFLFEARQRRFTFDGEHYFVDLVFYNRLLRCYVLIDLKLGKLTHQDLGQMQMYVNYFDRNVKMKEEQPTVGIVLCKQKNKALVEITLPDDANIHAREYRLYLPSKKELKQKLVQWADEHNATAEK